ncbi:hypothetical protein [Clostridium sp.]|uniref:hypothetical protein n=1 Tax=Clostridium sp. TaxID=1506 RepID=UPI00283D42C7|nr:hypothetical protein [Clostridium sp.]MDR3598453.1 hypothetical protein [Clostridium sp.]
MKMKKLLSTGAIGLALACVTSVGASAAVIPSNADLINIAVKQYENGTNPVGVLSGVDKNTKISSIFSQEVLDAVDSELSGYQSADTLVTKIDNNKDNTVATVINKIIADEATFTKFQNKFVEIAQKVQAIDNKVGADRIAAEDKVVDIVKAYDSSFDVTFGKDYQGKTTASISKGGSVVIQLNSDNLQTIIDRVNSITWEQVSAAKLLLK